MFKKLKLIDKTKIKSNNKMIQWLWLHKLIKPL